MKYTGGSAFPYSYEASPNGERFTFFGMTLRDYFAAKAMHAHITHDGSDDICESGVARWAYAMADAMLAERART